MSGKNLKASVIIGGSVANSFRAAMKTVVADLKGVGNAIGDIAKRNPKLGESIEAFSRMQRKAGGLRSEYNSLATAADRLRAAQSRLANVQTRIDANMARRRKLGGQLMGAVGAATAVGYAVFQPIEQAVKFETAMLGITKQVNGAKDAAGNLTPVYFSMARAIQQLAHDVPMATNDLADMVTAGARMGIDGEKNLITFTRTAAMMATAFDAPAADLADQMGRISNLFTIPIPQITELADSINYLDDNSVSKGADIIEVLTRIGGMAKTVRMTAKDAAALGSTFLSLGSSAETAGTTSNALMRILGTSDATTRKRIHVGLAQLGLDPKAIQSGMATNATATILKVVDALNKLPNEARLVAATRIFGAEYASDIAKLAGGVKEYRRELGLANGEKAEGKMFNAAGSMAREMQSRMKTTAAQWQISKNRMAEMAQAIGSALLPAVNDLFVKLAPLVQKFGDWARANPKAIQGIVGTVLAVTSLTVAGRALSYAWTFVRGGMLAIEAVSARLRVGWALTSARVLPMLGAAAEAVMGVIAAASAPVIGAVVAIGAVLVVVGLAIRKYWQPIAAFITGYADGIRTSMAPVMKQLGEALAPLKPVWDSIVNALGKVWNWFVQLVAPVQMTGDQLSKTTAAGRSFGMQVGAVLGAIVSKVVTVIGWWVKLEVGIAHVAGTVISAFGTALSWLQTTFGRVITWIINKMGPLKGTFGFLAHVAESMGAGPSPAAPGLTPPKLPATGRAAAARGAAGAQTHTYYITQQPGESSESLARRIADAHRRQAGIDQRGALADGAH